MENGKIVKSWFQFSITPADFGRSTVIILILANLVPLYGVLFLDWQVFPILLLFWMENVIIGVFNVFKMLLARPKEPGQWVSKVFMIPFFCFHYGMFTLVHGIFIFVLFGGYGYKGASMPDELSVWDAIGGFQLVWAILALVCSHGTSFVLNYIGKKEYMTANLNGLMGQPYGRVVILHITIIAAGFLLAALDSPELGLVLLLVLKTFIDILAHVRQNHRTIDIPSDTPSPG